MVYAQYVNLVAATLNHILVQWERKPGDPDKNFNRMLVEGLVDVEQHKMWASIDQTMEDMASTFGMKLTDVHTDVHIRLLQLYLNDQTENELRN